MKALALPFLLLALLSVSTPSCSEIAGQQREGHEEEAHKIVVTSPVAKDVVIPQPYVCQIHSRRHIEIQAQVKGYLEPVNIQEGQAVKKGDVLFRIQTIVYVAELNAKKAEADLARIEYEQKTNLYNANIQSVAGAGVVSQVMVAKAKAKLAQAEAEVKRAEAELQFTVIKAPFDGIIDRQYEQEGSLIEEGDILTTMSDNSQMWVYFNVPEKNYLEYMAGGGTRDPEQPQKLTIPDANIQLELADGSTFDQTAGDTVTVEGHFNNENGNIAFRADFPNPDRLLRHGQTGTVLIHKTLHDAIVIPQLAAYEILDKQYVYVVNEPDAKHGSESVGEHSREPVQEPAGEQAAAPGSEQVAEQDGDQHGEHGDKHPGGQGVVRQREIVIQEELDDVFIIKSGLGVDDRIVLEGVQHLRDGDTTEYELRDPEEALSISNLKYHAE